MTLRRVGGAALGVAMSLLLGCDSDDLCGTAMRYDEAANACVCDDDAIAVTGGCQRCAADEVPTAGVCACPPGESKDGNGHCATVPGLGDTCDAATPCTDAVYGLCGTQGTCTRTCATDDDCPQAYTCADWEPAPSCRTFSGVGDTCAGPEDCAGNDAAFCAQDTCAVAGCTLGVDDCPRGSVCCDFSAFGIGTMCSSPELCP